MSGPRYAIYYAPAPESALWRFGCETLGYDAASGGDVASRPPAGFDAPLWRELTEEPRRYGFHATLKAPFRLAPGRSEAQLRQALHGVAAELAPVPLGALRPAGLGRFVALVPQGDNAALQATAFAVVKAFEPFRAAMSPAERERRLRQALTPAQLAHLDAYGYPYVDEAFRFHMTLTGSLPAELVAPARDGLAGRQAAAAAGGAVTLDALALYRQDDAAARFRLLERIALAPGGARN